MKTRKIRKRTIIIIVVVLLALIGGGVGIGTAIYRGTDTYKLGKLGYTKEEIKVIKEKAPVNRILELEYSDKLVSLLNEKYYIPSHLENYLNYQKANNNKSTTEVISIINVGADKVWYTDPTTTDMDKGYSILVNKFHSLVDQYLPDDVEKISNWYSYEGNSIREEVNTQYVSMWNAAKDANVTLIVNSSFRDFNTQTTLYDDELSASGKEYADKYAARPGFSEHQTGLALDIVTTGVVNGSEFDQTEAFTWLQQHASDYGFILRYPKEKEYLTGYAYESWHYRYLGKELAKKVEASNLTYDEYYAYYCEYKNEC